jgi:uncharacterized membrane protein YheB (UPF0754 family)
MKLTVFLIPLISAFIGWFTNWIAIKMLFHPREPKRILGLTFHGIFPKRQKQFAEKLGKIVSTELISFEDIKNKLVQPSTVAKVMPLIRERLDGFIKTKLTEKMPILSMFIGNNTLDQIKESMVEELANSLPEMLEHLGGELKNEFNVEQIVADKVNNFSSDKLEEILLSIMSKEFRFVEIIGAVLGFLIGLLQLLIS